MLGASKLIDRLLARPYLAILMYHGIVVGGLEVDDWCFIDASMFRRQMRWLARSSVRVLPLCEAVERLQSGRLEGPTVAITFDDGYRNNIDVALPILEELRLPATIFLTTGLIGSSEGLWPSRIIDAVARSTRSTVTWGGRSFELSSREARARASAELQSMVKDLAGDAPDRAVAAVEEALGRPVNPAMDGNAAFAIMGAQQIQAALNSGLIEFGAHSVTHPLLSRLDDDRLAAEVDGSVADVERLTGRQCRSFAYPNGRAQDFDERAVDRLRALGITVAVLSEAGTNTGDADPLRLRRWGVGTDCTPLRYGTMLHNLSSTGR